MTFDPVPSSPVVRAAASRWRRPTHLPVRSRRRCRPSRMATCPPASPDRDAPAAWGFLCDPWGDARGPRAGDDTSLVLVGPRPAAEVGPAVSGPLRRRSHAPTVEPRTRSRDLATAPTGGTPDVAAAAQAVVEGVVLGRHRHDPLRSEADTVPVERRTCGSCRTPRDAACTGPRAAGPRARRGAVPRPRQHPGRAPDGPGRRRRRAALGIDAGLDVTVHDKELPSRSVRRAARGQRRVRGRVLDGSSCTTCSTGTPSPATSGSSGRASRAGLRGGISLLSNAMHAAMKMDMTGAGAVLAAMTVLREPTCPCAFAYLRPDGQHAVRDGDEASGTLVTRAGRGRSRSSTPTPRASSSCRTRSRLRRRTGVDAIVDIATLTGACLAALAYRRTGGARHR